MLIIIICYGWLLSVMDGYRVLSMVMDGTVESQNYCQLTFDNQNNQHNTVELLKITAMNAHTIILNNQQ